MDTWKHFPNLEGFDKRDIKLTEEGSYSITKERDAKIIWSNLKTIISDISQLVVLDGTANIGSDSIRFGVESKFVYSIEISEENYEALVENINLYGLNKKVKPILGDITELWNKYNYDILYLDPPWGGKDYKDVSNLEITLSDTRIDIFLRDYVLDSKNRPKWIIMKLPVNYNFGRLRVLPNILFTKRIWTGKFYVWVAQTKSPFIKGITKRKI
jgi:predicted RNA methylase